MGMANFNQKRRQSETSGESVSRASAINQAHEAIGEALRANADPEHEAQLPRLVNGALHILHELVVSRPPKRSRRCDRL